MTSPTNPATFDLIRERAVALRDQKFPGLNVIVEQRATHYGEKCRHENIRGTVHEYIAIALADDALDLHCRIEIHPGDIVEKKITELAWDMSCERNAKLDELRTRNDDSE